MVQRDGVGPYLGPCLAQEALGAEPVEGFEQPVEQGSGTGKPSQLVVLGADPGSEHAVDRLVVGLPAGQQRRVAELLVGDHRQQRLRQVIVDVGVHAEQHMPERGQVGGGAERDVPGPGRPLARQRGFQSVQVEIGERDVPPLHPLGIVETAALDLVGYRDRGPLVGGVEVAPLVASGLQRAEHGRHPGDHVVDHAAIMSAAAAACADGRRVRRGGRQASRPAAPVLVRPAKYPDAIPGMQPYQGKRRRGMCHQDSLGRSVSRTCRNDSFESSLSKHDFRRPG